MNSQIDSLTQEEMMEYFAHKEPRRHPLRATGCLACDDEQALRGDGARLCKSCQKDMESYYGRK